MDLFATDHPLEAEQSAKPRLSGLDSEKLPYAARHRIHRELLLKPKETDDESTASYSNEHDKLSERIADLIIEIGEGDNQMHPEIMRTNKIHEEAAAVLCGENWFTWTLCEDQYRPMWHCLDARKVECPRHYSRLITKIRIITSFSGDENDPAQSDTFYWTTRNVNHACKKLTLNNLKILKVDYYNSLAYYHGGSARKGYYGERCLEPLKKCRAKKGAQKLPMNVTLFLINRQASPIYAAELKAVIEGPMGAEFWAYRKAVEDEAESDYNEPTDDDDCDPEGLLSSDNTADVVGERDKDEEGSRMEETTSELQRNATERHLTQD